MNSDGQGGAQNFFMTLDSTKGQTLVLSYEDIPNLAVNEVAVITSLKAYKDIYLNTYHDYSLCRDYVPAGIRDQVYTGVLGSGRRVRTAGRR